jgi:hypothetical protein
MTRTITIPLEAGDTTPTGCGQCPFKVVDYDMGGPRGGALLCMNPAWGVADVTVSRREECVQAEQASGELKAAREAVGAAWLAGGTSLADAIKAKTAFLELMASEVSP